MNKAGEAGGFREERAPGKRIQKRGRYRAERTGKKKTAAAAFVIF